MEILNNFVELINSNILVGILISLLAGVISSFSPCTLSTLPLILGYISDDKESEKPKGLKYSLFFSMGIVITFCIVGVISAVFGKTLRLFGNWWYLILSLILIFVTLQLFNVFPKNNSCKRPKLRKNAFGAFLLGILGGFFASPCSTPILIAIVSFIASGANIFTGVIYMLMYSIGFCTLIVIAGVSVQTINKLAVSPKYKKIGGILRIILGVVTLILALILLYNIF